MAFPSFDWEEIEGQEYTYSRTDGSGTLTYKVPFADLDLFRADLFPEPYIAGTTVVQPPAASWPGNPWLVAKSFKASPWDKESPIGGDETPAAYAYYTCAVSFGSVDYDQYASDAHSDQPAANAGASWPTTFTGVKVSVAGEILTLPQAALRWQLPADAKFSVVAHPWEPPSKEISVGGELIAGVIVPSVEVTVSWKYVPFPNWAVIFGTVGRINHAAFAGFGPETLLFLGMEASRDSTSQGLRTWTLEMKYTAKNQNWSDPANPQGWNFFPRLDGLSAGKFQRLQRKVPHGSCVIQTNPKGGTLAIGTTAIPVNLSSVFPETGAFTCGIGAAADSETNTNVSVAPSSVGAFLSVAGGGTTVAHGDGEDVVQLLQTTLNGAIAATDVSFLVASLTALNLPSGQSFVQIDSEVMCVTSTGVAIDSLFVLRGVQGTTAAAHANGATVSQYPATVYELADFSPCYQSGLIVG